jgi:2-oxoglutarate ferredoxin oxidoreductase subunit alpha
LKELPISIKEIARCKNFFALGIMFWLYSREMDVTLKWIEEKFKNDPDIMEANKRALIAGYNYGENTEIFTTRYEVVPAKLPKGFYRNISGNEAMALGFVTASLQSGLQLFLGSYPITPASDILHELSKYKNYGVKTFQAEDEISAISAAIGASFTGSLAITTTSGPGLSLKTEAIGLAVMTELPVVIIDVQRGGPSTGLPTKTEQADLLQSLYGRNGEAPLCVLAAATPADCFNMAIEASKIAIKYMTPVILLSDGYIANGSEPWKIPEESELPKIEVSFASDKEKFQPYARDENLSRPWAIPGVHGFEHRIGGLEKSNIYGMVDYEPLNHDYMVKIRTEKIKKIVQDVPDLEINGDTKGDLLVVGWGGTYGSIVEAINQVRKRGFNVSFAHFRYINPLPKNTKQVLKGFKKILLPEINLGQFARVLKSNFLMDIIQYNKVRGLPFKASEIEEIIINTLGGGNGK